MEWFAILLLSITAVILALTAVRQARLIREILTFNAHTLTVVKALRDAVRLQDKVIAMLWLDAKLPTRQDEGRTNANN